uniref:Uncharacterized protein n=1 Tax=Periophthalmus magnuspinnatus TaxID=409849 RepID=A0A3B4A7S2_9GOBI
MECQTLNDMFDKTSSCFSEQTAVIFDDGTGRPESLSYGHLRALSAELCNILRESLPNKGVIGLYCHEHLLLPVWILGIMQTPAAYAPLDPADPGLLSSRVMERCGLIYCMVQTQLLEIFQKSLGEMLSLAVCVALPKFNITVVKVKSLHEAEADEQTEGMKRQTEYGATELKDTFAYVLHTSGTTGIPKIVKVPHKCIHPNICDLSLMFQIEKGDVVFLASPLTFDPSVVEMFMALTSGAKLLIVPALLKRMPKRLTQLLFKSHKTTIFQATPSLFSRFGPSILKEDVLSASSSLRILLLGGESCPTPKQLADWKHKDNKTDIYNIYGITEVSCWACCYRITERELQSRQTCVSYLRNVVICGEHRVCLLDDEDTLVSGTMRATGDWVKLKNGQMHFLGRRDRMIKRHGQRLSLDEVQQLILMVPLVEACAVDIYENHRLIAFIVMSKSEDMGRIILEDMKQYNSLGLPKDVPINEDSNFLLSGGDSLKALVFHEDLLAITGLTSLNLLEIILDGTFKDLLHHISEVKLVSPLENNGHVKREATKRHLENLYEVMAKRERTSSEKIFKVIKRGSQIIVMSNTKSTAHLQTTEDVTLNNMGEFKTVSLKMHWLSDTGRCVDASPVILVQQMDTSTVFIGSHSHRIQALDLDSGNLVWERVLGDRIEASATVSSCGTLVIVGCYDGGVYFLNVSSGETEWVFKTGDTVKCCPAVDAETGLALVGSHDGHVYALDPKNHLCAWKHPCGGGAVFSSPFIHPSLRHLFVATLGGRLLCLNIDTAEELWSYSKDVPFFSSPVSSDTHVIIGSADGYICGFSLNGQLLWQFLTQAPVFSSPCLTPDLHQVLCGSHDGYMYCLNISDGALVWRFETSGRVYSSPFVFGASALRSGETLVGLASTDGTVWILDVKTGLKRASHTFPGELFSSPVVHKGSLVIGCRNDYVYCLKLEVT